MSPQPSSSEFSSLTDASVTVNNISHIKIDDMDFSESFPEFDESIWSEPPLAETTSNNIMPSDLLTVSADDKSQAQSQFNPIETEHLGCNYDSILDDDMDFWYELFIRAGGSAELSEFWKCVGFHLAAWKISNIMVHVFDRYYYIERTAISSGGAGQAYLAPFSKLAQKLDEQKGSLWWGQGKQARCHAGDSSANLKGKSQIAEDK